jgi:hypothetical protein
MNTVLKKRFYSTREPQTLIWTSPVENFIETVPNFGNFFRYCIKNVNDERVFIVLYAISGKRRFWLSST